MKKKRAIILAAGRGRRLNDKTADMHKSMLNIGGGTLIENLIRNLIKSNITDIVLVLGYRSEELQKHIEKQQYSAEIKFILNEKYASTDNIYSVYLAREFLTSDTLVIEADMIFDESYRRKVFDSDIDNFIAVSKTNEHSQGTMLDIENTYIKQYLLPREQEEGFDKTEWYEISNVFKFCKETIEKHYLPKICELVNDGIDYVQHEVVVHEMINNNIEKMRAVDISECKWVEIDNNYDLERAMNLFEI